MPRNKKTSSREKQQRQQNSKNKGKDKDDDMSDSQSDEDILLKAFDAWTHVFLHSYLSMDDPIQQLKIEHNDLEYQWGRFTRGQEGLDPDPTFRFLENHHILEFALEEDFIQRHDFAVMVRHLFMRDLDLTRCDQGLSGYIRMFRPQLDESASKTVDDPGMYWKTLMQIVCLVMALHMRENQDMSDFSPIEDLEWRWEQKTRIKYNSTVNLERISDTAMAWMFDIATRAALDTNRLYGLYQNTLKLVILQLEEAVQELSPPVNEDGLVDNLMEIRNNQLTALYQKFERLHPDYEFIDPDWFEKTDGGGIFAGSDDFTDDEGEREAEFGGEEESEAEWQDGWEQLQTSQQQDERLVASQQQQVEEHGIQQKVMYEVKVESQELKLELATQDDGDVDGTDNDEYKEESFSADDIGEKTDRVEDRGINAEENGDEREHRPAEVTVDSEDDHEDEEDEPLSRRRRVSKQAFDPYAIAHSGGVPNNVKSKGRTISFTRPGQDNVAQASLLLSKSVQMEVAKIRGQNMLHADTTFADAAASSNTDSQQDSTPPHGANQKESESSKARTPQLEHLPPTPTPTSATELTPVPEPTQETTTTALEPVPKPELQSEPDPFISNKYNKTKRIFKAPSESEFEDDDDVPFRELKKMKATQRSVSASLVSNNHQLTAPHTAQDAASVTGGNDFSSSGSGVPGPSNLNGWIHRSNGTATTTNGQQRGVPVTNVAHVLQTSRHTAAPKEKRKYRPWSKEEVDRLMELAPRFFHAQTAVEGDGRKRNVKWAKLKTYDEHHGNVLKHRTQVNLKDKYREKTDEGQHRQEVAQIRQTKADAIPQYKFPQPKRKF
ncbi:MAG: hypothetical protein J3R72DRAFT_70915 [Linnemannia gamsii]|nr:MAG: hypothetical protein J3R72DRAFT_70915 [Linnemannia gamsii]